MSNIISLLGGDLAPIRDVVNRLSDDSLQETTDGLCVSHRPRIGNLAYAVRLYRGRTVRELDRYVKRFRFEIPDSYRIVLTRLNGADIFRMSLFGIPPSMLSDGLLDRSVAQPKDIGTANTHWRMDFDGTEGYFHFGGGPLTHDENVGYFLSPDSTIVSRRENGEEVGRWSSWVNFLADEISRSEEEYPAFEEFMESLTRKYRPKKI